MFARVALLAFSFASALLLAAVSFLFVSTPALAMGDSHIRLTSESWLENTHLIEVRQGSELSRTATQLRRGGYELADGGSVSLKRWYGTSWKDMGATWITQLNDNVGVIFGGSTGERGEKYSISPSLKLGLLLQARPAKDVLLTFRATTVIGGGLREKSCTADYGEIGGVQRVNCRLAASTLAPEETLQYLINEDPTNRHDLAVHLNWQF